MNWIKSWFLKKKTKSIRPEKCTCGVVSFDISGPALPDSLMPLGPEPVKRKFRSILQYRAELPELIKIYESGALGRMGVREKASTLNHLYKCAVCNCGWSETEHPKE